MSSRNPAARPVTPGRRTGSTVLLVPALVVAVIAAAFLLRPFPWQSPSPQSPSAAASSTTDRARAVPGDDAPRAGAAPGRPPPRVLDGPGGDRRRADGAEGARPDEVTVFDDEVPSVANLDPALLDAVRRAADDAADDGIVFTVTSGWRTPGYQDELFREAVAEYGSQEAAARWVATSETSLHVSGDAIDIGPAAAMTWLSGHGAAHGLCQVYANEPWHFELDPGATARGCPAMYADPSQDPRMRP